MNNRKQSKHDSLVKLVEEELLARGYTDVILNEEYNNKGICGEVDAYVITGKYVLSFECKCTKNQKTYKKAVNQLERSKKYLFNKNKRVFPFLVYYNKNEPVYELIKNLK